MTADAGDPEGGDPSGDLVIQRFHELCKRTQNPVYAWFAISYLVSGAKQQAAPDWPTGKDLVLPGWIANYLQRPAEQICMLASGVDVRTDSPIPDLSRFSTLEEVLASEELRQYSEATRLMPADAMKLVPAALDLTRDRWNAFASFAATTQKMREFRVYEALRALGERSKVAAGKIGDAAGVVDLPHVYKRIQQGRLAAVGEDEEVANLLSPDTPSAI